MPSIINELKWKECGSGSSLKPMNWNSFTLRYDAITPSAMGESLNHAFAAQSPCKATPSGSTSPTRYLAAVSVHIFHFLMVSSLRKYHFVSAETKRIIEFLTLWYTHGISQYIWRFLEIGLPPVIISILVGFSLRKTNQLLGYLHLWKPPAIRSPNHAVARPGRRGPLRSLEGWSPSWENHRKKN